MDELVKMSVASVVLTAAALISAPVANAEMNFGNYDLHVPDRYDFHTWVWSVTPCAASDCVHVKGIAQPNAKAFVYEADALLVNGRYAFTVDVPDGLRCGNVYYGPIVPTRDHYSWDATTLTGSLESSFPTGCVGEPAGTYTYPMTLVRM
jgi:hypothetical protein